MVLSVGAASYETHDYINGKNREINVREKRFVVLSLTRRNEQNYVMPCDNTTQAVTTFFGENAL